MCRFWNLCAEMNFAHKLILGRKGIMITRYEFLKREGRPYCRRVNQTWRDTQLFSLWYAKMVAYAGLFLFCNTKQSSEYRNAWRRHAMRVFGLRQLRQYSFYQSWNYWFEESYTEII